MSVSLRARLLVTSMKLLFGRIMPSEMPLETYRRASNQMLVEPMPRGIAWQTGTLGGVAGEWIRPAECRAGSVLLYLHGGGYVLRTPHVHRVLVGRLARKVGIPAFMVDYRLAPEHPFPAALEDAAAAYGALLRQGIAPERIVVAGDSAGGGLTAALLLHLRDTGVPLPAAAALISPMLDCSFSGSTLAELQTHDPYLRLTDLERMARHYYGDRDPRDPLISPLFADLQGLPPLLLYAGEHEVLRAEAEQFAGKVTAAGGSAVLKIWDGMVHAFPVFAGFVPEGQQAIGEIGVYFREQIGLG